MSNIVAIVGRPNVGKSTFYNRLVGERDAIVDNFSGVTRDRKYGTCEWNGKKFMVVDTGGFVEGSDDIFEKAIRAQVKSALEEASVVVFMVDATTGVTDLDEDIVEILRRTRKPVILAVNKVDTPSLQLSANEFWSLGFEEVYFIQSVSGSGTGDLLDAIAEKVENEEPLDTELPKFAIVGQPNVGKSSLLNALLGEERTIVTEVAGTTRDPIHSHYNKFGKEFIIVDTAGIRRKSRVVEDLEFYSVMRAIKAMEDSDIVLLMLDATKGVTAQDLTIFGLAKDRNKGIVVIINKWDLIPNKDANTAKTFEEEIKGRLAPFVDVPVIFTSVLEKQRIMKAIEIGLEVHENRIQKITTSKLNEWLEEASARLQPPSFRGHLIKIKYMTQLPIFYPAFVLFCNHPREVPENYRRYLENSLRAKFNFTGVPISLFFRDK